MAKGWESKSVEDQIQQHHGSSNNKTQKELTALQAEARRKTNVLLLSRARVEKDLNASQNTRYRDQLNRALTDIDAQISQLKESL